MLKLLDNYSIDYAASMVSEHFMQAAAKVEDQSSKFELLLEKIERDDPVAW